MTDRVLCRYYMEGTCRYGSKCAFSHDLRDAPSTVCKYWAQGYCKYGDQCMYDHKWPKAAASNKTPSSIHATTSSSSGHQSAITNMTILNPAEEEDYRGQEVSTPLGMHELRATLPDDPFSSGLVVEDDDLLRAGRFEEDSEESQDPWAMAARDAAARSESTRAAWTAPVLSKHADGTLCPAFLASGSCPRGESCERLHGLLCTRCGRYALHPSDRRAAAAHEAECSERHGRLAARSRAAALECGICLERVMGKLDPGQRRFGLLNCEHPFCLSCIRAWRQEGDVDTDTALRTCPVCRQTAHFVTPSAIWPETAEQRQAIIDGYRAKLAAIDCMHFDKGRGICPFGISCHYRHAYEDGTLEDRSCRLAAMDDGEIRLVKPVQLSDFIQITRKKSKPRR